MFSDAHCDTISRILNNGQDLLKNDGHLDLVRLKDQGCVVQIFAAWIDPLFEPTSAFSRCIDIIDKFYLETEKNKENLHVILNSTDIDFAVQNNKIGALLSIEGGSALGGKLSALRMLYKLGVRAITLTWNGRNELADGVGEGEMAGGLSSFGREVVCEMNKLGMIVDVSHLAEKGFWDVAHIATQPFIASHSNAKALCSHRRNLTDEQIKHIIKIKGFIGINFYSLFLNDDTPMLCDVIRHIEHIMSLGGEDILGIGADFDGVDDLPKEICGVENIDVIINELGKLSYSDIAINKILYGNLHSVIKRIMKK